VKARRLTGWTIFVDIEISPEGTMIILEEEDSNV
jgi:hypothetical protein